MKPHIAQTISDLRAEREHLNGMIAALERYGAEESNPPAPVPPEAPTPQGENPTPAALAQPRSLRRDSLPTPGRKPDRPPKAKPAPAAVSLAEPAKDPEGVTELVRVAAARLQEPFSRVDVIHWLTTHYTEKDIKPAAVDGVLFRFRKSGELVEAGERPGLTGPLTLHTRCA